MSRLWYRKPAGIWDRALPVGNGRLGGMVFGGSMFGGLSNDRIQLNEESVWYGKPMDRNNPDALENLPRIRELIFSGRIHEAEDLIQTAMSGCPNTMRMYQTLGELHINAELGRACEDYLRELDLDEAVCRISFRHNGVGYTREVFASYPDDCIVVRLAADTAGALKLRIHLERNRYLDGVGRTGGDTIWLQGNLGEGGAHFVSAAKASVVGGTLQVIGEHLCIDDADEAYLYLTACTDFKDVRAGKKLADYGQIVETLKSQCVEILDKAAAQSYETLRRRHVADYQALYGRVKLDLADVAQYDAIPTDERLGQADQMPRGFGMRPAPAQPQPEKKKNIDPGLSKLLFDFGRYLLISCSRPGNLPANLQGIWNSEYLPPWDSKYTVNINAEMNYWPAEVCGLPECHEPLLRLIRDMVKNGRVTARKMYGCRGWTAHHNTDAFCDTAPQDICITSTYWPMSGAWLCTHLWAHYEYTQDRAFLKDVFPVMLEAALFFLDYMVEKDGYLVTCPSVSPENTYILPSGERGAVSYGVTMDNQLLRDLFTQCVKAAGILENEDFADTMTEMGVTVRWNELVDEIAAACGKLAPTRIGSDGRVLEWIEEYEEAEPGHRHISHLYGLYPSNQMSVDKTPELAAAARKTLEHRLSLGGGHTGWSRAWIINLYARLHDGEEAYRNIQAMLETSTYPNMFDRHPPFQIDGNFGAVSGMAEMLVQSDEDTVILLPALPKAWATGSVRGLRIRGGGSVEMAWKDGVLTSCTIMAEHAMERTVKYAGQAQQVTLAANVATVIR